MKVEMKIIILTFSLLMCSFLYSQNKEFSDISTCPFKLGDAKPVTSENKEYNHPRFSKDGKKLIVTKKGYSGVYIIDLEKSNTIITVTNEPRAGFRAKWSEDGSFVDFNIREKNQTGKIIQKKMQYNIANKSIRPVSNSSNEIKNAIRNNKQSIRVFRNPSGDMVLASDGVKTWNITKETGGYYRFVLSPDKSKVLIHKNDGKMYVYYSDGSGLHSCVGRGLCQSWSPDGKYLLYFIDNEFGQNYIVDSDIYIATVSGDKHWKITNTEDKIELWPYWSPTGDKISYYELNSGQVFICNLLKSN